MQFALIGDHPHGLALARALAATGRHQLAAYAGPRPGAAQLEQAGLAFIVSRDLEELLARRELELVIVADALEHRPAVLRRAVQSELHVLCVHPADLKPDIAYEAGMIQHDTRKVLLPLLPARWSPGLARLRQLCQEGLLGPLQLVECEECLPREVTEGAAAWEQSPLCDLWDRLRWLGGEVREVSALASTGAAVDEPVELGPHDPLTLTGRFERGGLFRVLLLAGTPRCRLKVVGDHGHAELTAAADWCGPVQLRYVTPTGEQVEEWPALDPWPVMVAAVEQALAGKPPGLSWLDAVRALELFDAARRSVERGRVVPMLYQDFTEEASFKGVMTATGCGLIWLSLILLIVGAMGDALLWLWYLIPALLVVFLGLQMLRWVVPGEQDGSAKDR